MLQRLTASDKSSVLEPLLLSDSSALIERQEQSQPLQPPRLREEPMQNQEASTLTVLKEFSSKHILIGFLVKTCLAAVSERAPGIYYHCFLLKERTILTIQTSWLVSGYKVANWAGLISLSLSLLLVSVWFFYLWRSSKKPWMVWIDYTLT